MGVRIVCFCQKRLPQNPPQQSMCGALKRIIFFWGETDVVVSLKNGTVLGGVCQSFSDTDL